MTPLNYEKIKKELVGEEVASYIDSTGLKIKQVEEKFGSTFLGVTGKERDEFIEKKLNPPSLIVPFYGYIKIFQSIPSQQEYIDFYYLMNREWIERKVPSDKNSAFTGRLCRTYPSLVRDVHFYILLKQSGEFQKVEYSLYYDLKGQVDIFIMSRNQLCYGLQLRVKTNNSQNFFEIKPFRNKEGFTKDVTILDMPLDLNSAHSIKTKGENLKVYRYKELDWLKNRIQELESNVNYERSGLK